MSPLTDNDEQQDLVQSWHGDVDHTESPLVGNAEQLDVNGKGEGEIEPRESSLADNVGQRDDVGELAGGTNFTIKTELQSPIRLKVFK